ncbi:hypothetical protein ANO11243_029820 [Dothideomycetidae sp. 11243]|nr:hypothetical protein ANO11243_029820 [fungal sp. No.11243]
MLSVNSSHSPGDATGYYSSDNSDTEPPRGRTRKRVLLKDVQCLAEKRQRLCKESVSNDGRTMSQLGSLPVLSPSTRDTTPAGSKSRSKSPVKTMQDLSFLASPRIHIVHDESGMQGIVNDTARALVARLFTASTTAFLPSQLAQHFDQAILKSLGSDALAADLSGGLNAEELLNKITSLLEDARDCSIAGSDEAAWSSVAKDILLLALEMDQNEFSHAVKRFEALDIRTQLPFKRYLPFGTKAPPGGRSATDPRIPARKADFALAFHRKAPRVMALKGEAFASIAALESAATISHSSDPFTSTLPLQCALEVKKDGEDTLEARLQLATWHASAIMHAREILRLAGKPSLPLPDNIFQVGWTVTAHVWTLWFTVQTEEETIHCVNALPEYPMGTSSRVALFRLVAVLRSLLQWMDGQYWPAFQTMYEDALERLTSGPQS